MKNIFKSQEQALRAAKVEAIQQREERDQQDVQDLELEIASDKFLIRHKSTQCDCGQTAAIEVVYFPEGSNGDQYTGFAGYCENCRQE